MHPLQDPTRHSDSTRINWDDNPFMCALTGKSCSGRQRMDVSEGSLMSHNLRRSVGRLVSGCEEGSLFRIQEIRTTGSGYEWGTANRKGSMD
eukprot:1157878-Pelagomonas_calceolata.AAC.5